MTKRDKANIKQILQDDKFNSLILLSNELLAKWGSEGCKRDSEFETLWTLAHKEGQIDGLKAFFDNLDSEASS